MKSNIFVNNEFYHIFCRGTEKRQIFLDGHDYRRFLLGMKTFNSEGLTWISLEKRKKTQSVKAIDDNLVNILCYCLMPNHYHLLVKQKIDNGITKFMRKLNTGYTMFFNLKYKRTGRLFESRFKSVRIADTDYLLHLWRYIHLNPLDLLDKNWRMGEYKNNNLAARFINDYPWSSYKSFIRNIRNDLINKDIFEELYSDELKNSLLSWPSRNMSIMQEMNLTLE